MGSVSRIVASSGLAIAIVWSLPTPAARACGGPPCRSDRFLPFEGALPANAPGILWLAGSRYVADPDAGTGGGRPTEADDLRFRCTGDAGVPREVSFRVETTADCPGSCSGGLLVPDEPLVVGEACEITVDVDPCEAGGLDPIPTHLRGRSQFTVTEPAAFPDSLGDTRAGDALRLNVRLSDGAGCDTPVEACVVDVDVSLGDAEPWRDALYFQTWVDDTRWEPRSHVWLPDVTGGSWRGRGRDGIFRVDPEVEVDDHGLVGTSATVRITATIVGTDDVLESTPTTLSVDCAPMGDTGCSCTITGLNPGTPGRLWFGVLLIGLATRRRRWIRSAGRREPSRSASSKS